MKHLAMLGVLLAVCIGCTDARPPASMNERQATYVDPVMDRQPESSDSTARSAASTQKAYVDPQTGKFVPPPRVQAPPDNQPLSPAALSMSVETLQEEPSPVPGGGMMIDLKGRYRSPITATIDGDGRTTVEHRSDAPGD